MKTLQERQYLIEQKLRELRRAKPEASYDELWRTMNALPEMQPVFAAMQKPVEAARTPNEGGTKAADIKTACARFLGLVKKAEHERGITFDAAWNAVRVEEPDLFKAMGGGDQPLDGYPILDRYPQPMAGRSWIR